MIQYRIFTHNLCLAIVLLGSTGAGAQLPLPVPPPISVAPVSGNVNVSGDTQLSITPPDRDIGAEVKRMTRDYQLTKEQASQVKKVLKEETPKYQAVLKDFYAAPGARARRLASVRKEEYERVSAILTEEQRMKYEKDMQPETFELAKPASPSATPQALSSMPSPPLPIPTNPAAGSSTSPLPPPPPSLPAPPKVDLDAEVKRLTKTYSLSERQAAQVRTILNEQSQKADAVLSNFFANPVPSAQRLIAIRQEGIDRISAVLPQNQRAKFQRDTQAIQLPSLSLPPALPLPNSQQN